jgi:glutamate-1-semialdehyde 2,1-aminomutase
MRTFENSIKHLAVAEVTIPLGSQTFSKSKTQYPVGISPLYASRAKGAFLWDIDNNKYIDLVNALASVTLGYGDTRVAREVSKQLRKGISLSLPTKLESQVADLLTELIPSAEMVRFSKNGSDATAAAIRIARSYTGRDHVLVCGYHGWQDWYIGSTSRNKGVPSAVSQLTHSFNYNDIDSLIKKLSMLENKVAAVILEPMNREFPKDKFLEQVRELTSKAGAVLIFDEIITGFRFSKGGAQALFNIVPDISTFGKGIANGFPLSAVVGKKEIMLEMENVFLSGTFGGELLSLSAAKSVLERHITEDVCGELFAKGDLLAQLTLDAIDEHNLHSVVDLSGHPTWKFINWRQTNNYSPEEIKTYFMQEIFQHGVLVLGTHNISLSHSKRIIAKIADSYSIVFKKIKQVLEDDNLRDKLRVPPLVPLFKVRQ